MNLLLGLLTVVETLGPFLHMTSYDVVQRTLLYVKVVAHVDCSPQELDQKRSPGVFFYGCMVEKYHLYDLAQQYLLWFSRHHKNRKSRPFLDTVCVEKYHLLDLAPAIRAVFWSTGSLIFPMVAAPIMWSTQR
jgi:hypothetical protein